MDANSGLKVWRPRKRFLCPHPLKWQFCLGFANKKNCRLMYHCADCGKVYKERRSWSR